MGMLWQKIIKGDDDVLIVCECLNERKKSFQFFNIHSSSFMDYKIQYLRDLKWIKHLAKQFEEPVMP